MMYNVIGKNRFAFSNSQFYNLQIDKIRNGEKAKQGFWVNNFFPNILSNWAEKFSQIYIEIKKTQGRLSF